MASDIDIEHAVVGIDPHKHTATIAVIDTRGGLRETASFTITPDGVGDLLGLLSDAELVIDRIGVEGTGSLGRPVVTALLAAGYDVCPGTGSRVAVGTT